MIFGVIVGYVGPLDAGYVGLSSKAEIWAIWRAMVTDVYCLGELSGVVDAERNHRRSSKNTHDM